MKGATLLHLGKDLTQGERHLPRGNLIGWCIPVEVGARKRCRRQAGRQGRGRRQTITICAAGLAGLAWLMPYRIPWGLVPVEICNAWKYSVGVRLMRETLEIAGVCWGDQSM